jgi:hypothetical protein
MKSRILRWLSCLALLPLLTAPSWGFMEPKLEPLPNLDSRVAAPTTGTAPSAEQQAALEQLRSRLPGVRVDFGLVTGAPKLISAPEAFLSAANGEGKAISAAAAAAFPIGDPYRATRAFLQEHRGLFGHGPEALDQARISREFTTPHNGLRSVVWHQQVDGIPVFGSVLISHTTAKGELVSLSSQFLPDPVNAADKGVLNRAALMASPPVSARQAVAVAARNLGEDILEAGIIPVEPGSAANPQASAVHFQEFKSAVLKGPAKASMAWLPLDRDRLVLCWDVVLMSGSRQEMFRVLVDVQTGQVLLRQGLTNYISDATYRVYPSDSPSPFSPGNSTPASTQPPTLTRTLVTLSALNTNASPNGWIDDGVNETRGNNADAHTDRNNDNQPDLPRPQGSPFRVFDFPLDLTQSPTTYTNAAVVQLFYWNNFMHDKLYELGFTEAAGNFQGTNFGRGGLGNDAVLADAQDGGGYNNANFSTPSDGSPGRMQMYLFNGPTPYRDGDLDAEVILHEYTHGLSNRRVGGGVGISALQSGGMGEGWSDFYALSFLSEAGDDVNGVYASGGYVTYLLGGLTQNYYYGIRRYPYCTDMSKNPLTFKDIDPSQASTHTGVPRSPIIGTTANEVHNMGEVWCVTLWEARAKVIAKYGWAVGNRLMLQLVTDGMNLSPANPNFLQARDAILQADQVDTGGANRAELWAAFAKRGMGYSATSPGSSTTTGLREAYDVPDALALTPAVVSVSGPPEGPFFPQPAYFMLTNTGSNTLSWTLTTTSSWVEVFPVSGTLPGGSSTNVVVTVTAAANSFAPGVYTATLRFTNQASGVVQAGTLALAVVGRHMFDDFDPSLDLSQWSAFGGTLGSTVLATNYGGSVSAPNSLWFGDSGSRYATTLPINTTSGGLISFWLRLANGSVWPWEMVDLPGEGVVLECSTNAGVGWTTLGTYNTTAYFNWTAVSMSIPATAQAPATLFRWRQLSNSGSCCDHWALDDVFILAEDMAPTITAQPQSQNVAVNDPATLTVTAYGTQPLSYQWLFNGSNITGATASSLVLTNVQVTDAGSYSVFISNRVGSVTSSNALLTVYVPVCAPTAGELVSWWRGEGDATDSVGGNNGLPQVGVGFSRGRVGQAFSFDGYGGGVLVTDSPSLRLTNQVTIEAWINLRSTNTDRSIVSKVGGAGGNNGYQLAFSKNKLEGLFNGPGQNWPSKLLQCPVPITLGAWAHAAWTYDQSAMKLYWNGQPVATNVVGAQAIAVSSSNLRIGNDDSGNTPFDGWIDEAAVYNRALSAAEIAGIYATGSAGKCGLAPAVVTPPLSQTVQCSSNVSFFVTASGMLPLAYQWYFGATAIGGGTNTSLTLTRVGFGQAGLYSVVITNVYGSVTGGPATLTVFDSIPPTITGCAADRTLSAVAECSAPLPDLTGEVVASDASGPVTVTQIPQAGAVLGLGTTQVSFTVSDSSGNSASCSCLVTVSDLTPPKVLACVSELTLSFGADCQARLPDLNGTNYVVATDNCGPPTVMQAPPAQTVMPLGTNTVVLTVSDSASNQTVRAIAVIVPGEPHIVTQPADQTAVAGTNVTFNIKACGAEPVRYQWQHSGTNLPFATNTALTLPNAQRADEGGYQVIASNDYASATSVVATLTLNYPPAVIRQPVSQLGVPGCAVTFKASVSGTPPLSCQWQMDGGVLEGRTNTTLALTNLRPGDFGTYTLVVTNAFGSATSSNAVLALGRAPVARADTIYRFAAGGVRVHVSVLLANDTDTNGDGLSILGVSSNSAAGGTVSLSGNWVFYMPPSGSTNADTFTYTVTDGHCATIEGAVTVELKDNSNPAPVAFIENQGDGSFRVTCDGVPGWTYKFQFSRDLAIPHWEDIGTFAADAWGTCEHIDWPSTSAPARFYRALLP